MRLRSRHIFAQPNQKIGLPCPMIRSEETTGPGLLAQVHACTHVRLSTVSATLCASQACEVAHAPCPPTHFSCRSPYLVVHALRPISCVSRQA
jgi:hypothetical protein